MDKKERAKYALWIFTSTVITYISGLLIEKVKKLYSTESKRIHLKKIIVVCNEVRQQVKHLFFHSVTFGKKFSNMMFGKKSLNTVN